MSSGGRLLSTSLTTGDEANARIVGGHGVWFRLSDGREVIDASNTAAPLGHCHPEIIEAVRRAADAPVINEGWQWAEREEAAEDLLRIAFAGEEWAAAVRFFISASEANDAALSLCQALTGRKELATRQRAYHGGAGLARELTVQPQWHGGLAGAGTAGNHRDPPARPRPGWRPCTSCPPPPARASPGNRTRPRERTGSRAPGPSSPAAPPSCSTTARAGSTTRRATRTGWPPWPGRKGRTGSPTRP